MSTAIRRSVDSLAFQLTILYGFWGEIRGFVVVLVLEGWLEGIAVQIAWI